MNGQQTKQKQPVWPSKLNQIAVARKNLFLKASKAWVRAQRVLMAGQVSVGGISAQTKWPQLISHKRSGNKNNACCWDWEGGEDYDEGESWEPWKIIENCSCLWRIKGCLRKLLRSVGAKRQGVKNIQNLYTSQITWNIQQSEHQLCGSAIANGESQCQCQCQSQCQAVVVTKQEPTHTLGRRGRQLNGLMNFCSASNANSMSTSASACHSATSGKAERHQFCQLVSWGFWCPRSQLKIWTTTK